MAPPRKAHGRAVDKRNGAPDLTPVRAVDAPLFPPPDDLRPDALEIWHGYWADRASGLLRDSDRGVVLRWITNVNRYLTVLAEADSEPVVSGSTGQPKPNGLYDLAYKIEDRVRQDEAQLGIGPKNGLSLGLLAIQERRSLADMNARYGPAEDGDGDEHADDPRLKLLRGAVEG